MADVQILIQGSSVVEGHRCFVLQRICVGEYACSCIAGIKWGFVKSRGVTEGGLIFDVGGQ